MRVVVTDYPWPDLAVEREILAAAGHDIAAGRDVPGTAEDIEALVAANDPAAIMTCWAPLSARAIAMPADLRILQRLGVGLDNIDLAGARARGVLVTNVPDYCAEEVSDHGVALLLAWARGLAPLDREVKAGVWNPAGASLRRVSSLTVGVLGYGAIGARTAAKVAGLGARVLVHSRSYRGPLAAGLDALLAASDAVIINLPLTAETFHLFDDARLCAMKPGGLLINVSRGGIVDNDALLRALERGQLSGAGLDVVEGEPNPPAALVGRGEVIVTPHVAFSSPTSIAELRRRASEEVVRVLAGEPPHHPCA